MKASPAVAARILAVTDALAHAVERHRFAAPVAYVYNPLLYAREPWRRYVERYSREGVEAVLLGMNPGPFGMAQTGIPFGEVQAAREWLGVEAPVGRPPREHPKRPVEGFACPRSEVSGRRLWGWANARFGTPERFFRRFFVYNYCPLVFMSASGANVTPDKLPPAVRERLFADCDRALRELVAILRPKRVVGVGAFALKRAQETLSGEAAAPAFGMVLHPSPASPAANRGWARQAEKSLEAMGIRLT